MKNLSEYICLSASTDFNTIWKEWSERYKPLEETIPDLKKLGEQLCKIDKKEIKNMFVFRRKYGIVRPYKNLLTMES